MRNWLKTYGQSVEDPRKAWIELDYCVAVAREDPAEARRVFAAVKERIAAFLARLAADEAAREDLRMRF